MNEQEKLQHEAIKNLLKQEILNNPNLSTFQKQTAIDRLDLAAKQADWILEMLRMCGYVQ